MATREQIELLRGCLEESNPVEFFKMADPRQVGMGAILTLLYEAEKTITAGMISEAMGVSTARVAVLLRKMSEKGLITKEPHARDARVTVVRLTERGEDMARKREEAALSQIGEAIDKVGMERMLEFVRTSKEIRSVMKKPDFDL